MKVITAYDDQTNEPVDYPLSELADDLASAAKGKGNASITPFGVVTSDGKWELSFGDQNGWTPRIRNTSGAALGVMLNVLVISGVSSWMREYQGTLAAGAQDTATNGSSWVNGATFGDLTARMTWVDGDGDFYEGIIIRSSQLNGNNPIFVKVEKISEGA